MKRPLLQVVFLFLFFLVLTATGYSSSGRYYDSNLVATMSVPDATVGTTYYIDGTNGNDSWDGLSATYTSGSHGPFKTIANATNRYSGRNTGGNIFKLKTGTYHEGITFGNLTGATDESHRLVIGPYGDGEVIIDGSVQVTWTAYSGNIYVANYSNSLAPLAIVMDDDFKLCRPVDSLAAVTSIGRWYYDSSNAKIYLYTDGNSPSTHNTLVVQADRYTTAPIVYFPGGSQYVTIYGLTIRASGSYGVYATGGYGGNNHIKIENCTIKHSGLGAINLEGGTYGEILTNHIYGNVLFNWPRGTTWNSSGGWPMNVVAAGYSHYAGNIVHDGGGEGMGSYGGDGNLTIEDNIVHDNWSVNIYLDNNPNNIVRRNLVYNTAYYPSDMMDSNLIPSWSSAEKISKRMTPEGIVTADETATNPTAHATGNYIYDNLIIGTRTGYSHYGQATGAGIKNLTFTNNTIVLPTYNSPYGAFNGIFLENYATNSGSVVYNNAIYGTGHGNLAALGGTAIAGVAVDYNIYYDTSLTAPFAYNADGTPTNINFSTWKSNYSLDASSQYTNPLFSGGTNIFDPNYYLPQSSSPLLNNGVTINGYATDFNSYTKTSPLTIGALDYGSVYSGGGGNVPPPTISINVAARASGGVASASSTYSANYPVTAVNDGDRKGLNWENGGGWNDATAGAYPDWVQVTFNGQKTIGEIDVFTLQDNGSSPVDPTPTQIFSANGITAFDVQYWNGASWITVPNGCITNNNLVWRKITFPALTTDRIRVQVNAALYDYSRIVEIEAYTVGSDNISPTISIFTMPATASSLSVPITEIIATDNVSVTGYMITESSTAPSSSSTNWLSSVPASFTFSAAGTKTAYAWARDAAGNVSAASAAATTITLTGSVVARINGHINGSLK